MQGWVAHDDDWKHVAVGNERLLKAHGGKVRPSKAMQSEIEAFKGKHVGQMLLFVVVEDDIKIVLALSGIQSWLG